MRARRWPIILILLGGFALRLYRLGFQSIWYDESVSLLLAHKSIPALTAHTAGDIHPPFYYYLLHFWIKLAGDSEFAAGYLSLWFGVLLIALAYRLGIRLFDPRVATWSAFLLAVSPYNLWYSQEVRMYTLGATTGLLALEAVLNGIGEPKRLAPWVVYAIFAALGLYTLYYFAFLLIALNAFLLGFGLRHRRSFPFFYWFLGQVMALILYLPWSGIAFRQATNPPVPPWRSFTPLPEVVELSWTALSFGQSVEPRHIWPLLIMTALVYLMGLGATRIEPRAPISSSERAALLALYTLGPLILIYAFSYLTPLYHPRYLFVYSPPFYVALSAGLCTLSRREIRYGFLAVFLALCGWSIYRFHFDPHYASDDHRAAVAFLERNLRPGDAVLINAGYVYPVLLYYYHGPIGWRGRLVNYQPGIAPEGAPVFLQTGSIGGASSLGWGNPQSDFYPTTEEETAAALERVFAHHPRVWVYRCYDTVVDPEGFIRRWLDANGLKFEDRLFAGESNLRVQGYLTRLDLKPPVQVGVTAGDLIELVGFELPQRQVEAGDSLDVALYWRAVKPLEKDYRVSLALFRGPSPPWAQTDEQPLGSVYTTSRWEPGKMLYHPIRLKVPVGTPPGKYYLDVTVYSPDTLVPLPVRDATWGAQGVRIRLGQIEVIKPSGVVKPPEMPINLRADFGGMVALEGVKLSSHELKAGEPLKLTLLWRGLKSPLPNLIVFVQLLDEEGKLVAAREVMPVDNRYPTSLWSRDEWVIDRHRLLVPGNTPTGRYRLILGLLRASNRERLPVRYGLWHRNDHIDLGYIKVEGRTPNLVPPPAPRYPIHRRLGDFAILLGFDVNTSEIVPEEPVKVTLYWQALDSAPASYKVFIHLVGQDEQIWSQQDDFPLRGELPTSAWIAGEYITDTYSLVPGAELPPGTYRLIAGMYHPETGQRVPVYGEDGTPLGDHILLMELKR